MLLQCHVPGNHFGTIAEQGDSTSTLPPIGHRVEVRGIKVLLLNPLLPPSLAPVDFLTPGNESQLVFKGIPLGPLSGEQPMAINLIIQSLDLDSEACLFALESAPNIGPHPRSWW